MNLQEFIIAAKLAAQRLESMNSESYDPPACARNNARKAIEWRKKYGDQVKGGTRVGWTRASQLATGKKLSKDIVKRMAQFARHRQNYINARKKPEYQKEPWKSRAIIAWLIWGGTCGVNWAIQKAKAMKD